MIDKAKMNTEVGQALDKAIKQARQEANLTQEELATRANVSLGCYKNMKQANHALVMKPYSNSATP